MPRDKVDLFWTGGWDSTFRLLCLAELDIDIQPWYLIHDLRDGNKYEQVAMDRILKIIRTLSTFRAHIFDIKKMSVFEIEEIPDDEIRASYDSLKQKYNLGYQYRWFALFCKHIGKDIRIEIGVENSERSKAMQSIWGEGRLIDADSSIPGQKILDISNSSKDLCNIFANCVFGMTDISKVEAKRISMEKGWMEIMNLTWFCFHPIHGKPCGVCNPCRDAMQEGMEWRMPWTSKFRYKYMQNRIGFKLIRLQRKFLGN